MRHSKLTTTFYVTLTVKVCLLLNCDLPTTMMITFRATSFYFSRLLLPHHYVNVYECQRTLLRYIKTSFGYRIYTSSCSRRAIQRKKLPEDNRNYKFPFLWPSLDVWMPVTVRRARILEGGMVKMDFYPRSNLTVHSVVTVHRYSSNRVEYINICIIYTTVR